MIVDKHIEEVREFLENSRNPVFFFDNDPDGLCSFLILQRYCGKGRGVAIKSFPGLQKGYFNRVEEFNADCIFVLDKPVVDEDFIQLAREKNIPLIIIDHHNVDKINTEHYYNTFHESGKNEPVAFICQKITGRKEDEWISAMGCITDCYLPDFIKNVEKKYVELFNYNYKSAFDILYNTEFGKIAMIISFGMKDTTSNLVSLLKFLMKANQPSDILGENHHTKIFLKRYEEINEKYQKLLKMAESQVEGDLIFFTYAGDLSISQYTANELMYRYPDKLVVVAYTKGNSSNISLRWNKDIRTITLKLVAEIEGSSGGGGHEHTTGVRIPADKLKEFKEKLIREMRNAKKI